MLEEIKKDFDTIGPGYSKSNIQTDVKNNITSNDNSSIQQNLEKSKDYIKYSDIKEKKVEWLWFPYIPKGMVSIVQGDPKCGKTFMLIDIISRITRGDFMPLSEEKFEIGNVVFLNSDDPIDSSLKGRMTIQNADEEKVFTIDENTKKLYFKDLSRLEKLIKEKQPVLVVFDPIQAYMGDGDTNSMVQVRKALSPLKMIAEEYNCAIVLVQHLKKGNESKAIYRGAGSIDFVGFARSMIMVIKDIETDERLFVHTTSNVAKEGHCLSYKITNDGLVWAKDKGEVNVDELLYQNNNYTDKNSKVEGFILGALSRGDLYSDDLKKLVLEKGKISEKRYNITKASLNKQKLIHPYQNCNKFYWTLTNEESGELVNEK